MRDPILRGARSGALTLLTALAVSLSLPAAAQAPKDTVVVRVVKDGRAVSGVPVKLVSEPPGGGEVGHGEVKTGEDGLARFTVPHRPNLFFTATVPWQGVRYTSEKRAYGSDPGQGLSLQVELRGAGASRSDLSLAEGSHLIVEYVENAVDVTAMLTVRNGSKATYAPEGGLVVPVPEGARNVRGIGGDPVAWREGEGAAFLQPFLPGDTQVRVRYEIPYRGDRLDLRQDFGMPAGGLLLFVDDAPGLQIDSPRVMGSELREAQGRKWRMLQLDARDGKVEATLTGLPYRSTTGRWLAGVLSGALVLVGLVLGAAGGGDSRAAVKRAAQDERDDVLAELEEIERDLADGRIDQDTYEEDRAGALDRLAVALRTLES